MSASLTVCTTSCNAMVTNHMKGHNSTHTLLCFTRTPTFTAVKTNHSGQNQEQQSKPVASHWGAELLATQPAQHARVPSGSCSQSVSSVGYGLHCCNAAVRTKQSVSGIHVMTVAHSSNCAQATGEHDCSMKVTTQEGAVSSPSACHPPFPPTSLVPQILLGEYNQR